MKGNCAECSRRWVCDIDPDECDAFPDPPPMTNSDRIRAMTDEELAKLLLDADQGNFTVDVCSERFCDTENCKHDCTGAALKWLQQPAERECLCMRDSMMNTLDTLCATCETLLRIACALGVQL